MINEATKTHIIKKTRRSLRNTCGCVALDLKKTLYNGLMNSAPAGTSDAEVRSVQVWHLQPGWKKSITCQGQCPR